MFCVEIKLLFYNLFTIPTSAIAALFHIQLLAIIDAGSRFQKEIQQLNYSESKQLLLLTDVQKLMWQPMYHGYRGVPMKWLPEMFRILILSHCNTFAQSGHPGPLIRNLVLNMSTLRCSTVTQMATD